MKKIKVLFVGRNTGCGGPESWKRNIVKAAVHSNIRYAELSYRARGISQIRDSIKKVKSNQIIHFYVFNFYILFVYFLSVMLDKTKVFTLHGNFIEEGKQKPLHTKLFYRFILPRILYSFDMITFPSNFLLKVICDKYPKIKDKSYAIYNTVINQKSSSKKSINEKDYLLTITNFNYYDKCRGISLLISALKKISYNKNLIVVGGGKYLNYFKEKHKKERVTFLGYRGDIPSLIENSDFVVHCTFLDNLPITIIETLALKKAIICSRIGGIPEMVCEESLFYNRPQFLSALLSQVTHSSSFKKMIISKNNLIFPKFRSSKVIKEMENLYLKTI